jgi:hypothetical protein
MVGKPGRGRRSPEEWAAIYSRWRDGETIAALASELRLSRQWVSTKLHRMHARKLDSLEADFDGFTRGLLLDAMAAKERGDADAAKARMDEHERFARAGRRNALMSHTPKPEHRAAEEEEVDVHVLRERLKRRLARLAERLEKKRIRRPDGAGGTDGEAQ